MNCAGKAYLYILSLLRIIILCKLFWLKDAVSRNFHFFFCLSKIFYPPFLVLHLPVKKFQICWTKLSYHPLFIFKIITKPFSFCVEEILFGKSNILDPLLNVYLLHARSVSGYLLVHLVNVNVFALIIRWRRDNRIHICAYISCKVPGKYRKFNLSRSSLAQYVSYHITWKLHFHFFFASQKCSLPTLSRVLRLPYSEEISNIQCRRFVVWNSCSSP